MNNCCTTKMGRHGGGGGGGGKAMRVFVALALLLAQADAACRGLQGEFALVLSDSGDNNAIANWRRRPVNPCALLKNGGCVLTIVLR